MFSPLFVSHITVLICCSHGGIARQDERFRVQSDFLSTLLLLSFKLAKWIHVRTVCWNLFLLFYKIIRSAASVVWLNSWNNKSRLESTHVWLGSGCAGCGDRFQPPAHILTGKQCQFNTVSWTLRACQQSAAKIDWVLSFIKLYSVRNMTKLLTGSSKIRKCCCWWLLHSAASHFILFAIKAFVLGLFVHPILSNTIFQERPQGVFPANLATTWTEGWAN